MLLEPKILNIDGKDFILSKFPAIAGREIVTQYPLTGLPKIGEYKVNEEIMIKLMSYVGVDIGTSAPLQLTTRALIDNHVPSWETLAKIEWEMLDYNVSFLADGRISTFLQDIAQTIPEWITKILIKLSEQSSQAEKPVLKSSKKSTRSKTL